MAQDTSRRRRCHHRGPGDFLFPGESQSQLEVVCVVHPASVQRGVLNQVDERTAVAVRAEYRVLSCHPVSFTNKKAPAATFAAEAEVHCVGAGQVMSSLAMACHARTGRQGMAWHVLPCHVKARRVLASAWRSRCGAGLFSLSRSGPRTNWTKGLQS